jgi:NTE family protein
MGRQTLVRENEVKLEEFTSNERVLRAVDGLERAVEDRPISDLVDGEGHQYVDLVMEGGGTLGIALLGYVYALEQARIRFLDIGGTSAGAITAMLLAAADTRDKPKSERLLEMLASQNIGDFVDGDMGVRNFIRIWLAKRPKLLKLLLVPFGPLAFTALLNHLGLNPGRVFQDWMAKKLAASGIQTVEELNARMKWLPPTLQRRDGKTFSRDDLDCHLALIASEVVTESKIEFPRMAELFWEDWKQQNPAVFVRASMSVPFFFYPMTVNLPHMGEQELKEKWGRMVGFEDVEPGMECHLIDGGIMSNFPINVFHEEGEPSAPTFGVRLGNRQKHVIRKPGDLGKAVFESARHTLDYDFILQHPDYKHLLAHIETGEHKWLDFELSREAQVDLFARGVEKGADFVRNFQWEGYKEARRKLARA